METQKTPEIVVINVEGKPVVCLIAERIFSHDLLGALRGLPEALPIAVVRDPSQLVVHDLDSLAAALSQLEPQLWVQLVFKMHDRYANAVWPEAADNPFFDL